MAKDDPNAVRIEQEPSDAPTSKAEETLKSVRHDVRGGLGIVQGALQTSLDQDHPLSLEQRIELASIAKKALPELAAALDRYIAVLENPGTDIRLPE